MKVGIIGCGNISGVYLKSNQLFPILEIVACAHLGMACARAKATEHNMQAVTADDLLAHP